LKFSNVLADYLGIPERYQLLLESPADGCFAFSGSGNMEGAVCDQDS